MKYWKDPIIAAKANNLTDFAGLVNDAGLSAVLNDSSLVSTIFAPSEWNGIRERAHTWLQGRIMYNQQPECST